MMELLFVVFFVILGAVMGSFCCCQVWRIRYKEEGKEKLGERSVCLHCKKQLRWYENIPVVSWLVQGGRCRKCGKKIGNMEIISEIVGAVMFGVLGSVTVFGGFGFPFGAGEGLGMSMIEAVVIGVGFVLMLMLAIYDAKWGELPMFLLIALAIVGVVLRIIVLYMTWKLGGDIKGAILGGVLAVGILGGVYYLLYFFSKEKLVGGGDWILGTGIGLIVGDWWLAIMVLFLANFVGTIVMVPLKKRTIPFGPFLVGATVVVIALNVVLLGLKP